MAIIQNLEAFVQSYPAGLDSVTDLQLSQNENGRQIRFTIGGVTIPAGSVATISGTKPDGVVYSNTGTIEGADTVIFDEDVQMTAVFGTWYAKIRITNAGNTIASARVRFIIDKDPVDAGAIPSESQLDGLVAEAEEYAEAAEDAAGRAAITYGSPLTASTAAAMTDVNRVYVYTGSESGYTYGNWYYYNGSAWVSGGIYNSAAVETDTTLTESGVPADAKATGDKIDELKDDLDEVIGGEEQREITGWVHQKFINVATPNIGDTVDITNEGSFYSLKYVIVNCEEGDKFLLNLTGAASARAWAFLTSSNVLISRADASVTLTDVTITAPQNAGKAIFQCIYRETQDDETTDNGTAYKLVQGTGNVVRFDIVQDKTEAEKARARENIGINGTGGEGLSDEAKAALLACFANVAWVNGNGQDYYDDLYDALYGGITPSENINVVFNNNIGRTFYTDDPIDSLKASLTVTYNGSTVTSYNLIGSFSENNIRVKVGDEYSGIVPVQAESPSYSYSTDSGDISFLRAGIKMTGDPVPSLDLQTVTKRAIGAPKGRLKYGNSNTWYSVPMPSDCTEITVNVEPSTFKYYITAWQFNPQTNTCTYYSESSLVSGQNTHTVSENNGLLVVSVMIQNSNNTQITEEPTKCDIAFS